jgi:hypothetical protein
MTMFFSSFPCAAAFLTLAGGISASFTVSAEAVEI